MFALVDAGFLLWVLVGAYVGLGEGGDDCGGLVGWRHAWVAEAVGAGPNGGLVEGQVDGACLVCRSHWIFLKAFDDGM